MRGLGQWSNTPEGLRSIGKLPGQRGRAIVISIPGLRWGGHIIIITRIGSGLTDSLVKGWSQWVKTDSDPLPTQSVEGGVLNVIGVKGHGHRHHSRLWSSLA